MEIRISLTEEQFKTLVAGGEVLHEYEEPTDNDTVMRKLPVRIILKDVGFDRMHDAVNKAQEARR